MRQLFGTFVLCLALGCADAMVLGLKTALGGKSTGQKALVSDFMTKEVFSLQATASLNEAAQVSL